MKKWQMLIMVGFFLTVSTVVTFRIVTTPQKSDRLQAAEEDTRINNLYFYTVFWQSVNVAGAASALLAGVMLVYSVSLARIKRASVHTYEIGQSKVIVHERDLSLAWPIATGLMNAEKLEHLNGGLEKALELYATMASVQNEQIRALLGPQRSQRLALPPAILPEAQEIRHVPTFRDLLTSGVISTGKPLVFGYLDDGSPKTGTWQDIFSGAIGGQSGYGKTSTLRSLIAQSLLQGIRFWIIDYHYPHPESLIATLGDLKDSPLVTSAEMEIDVPDILRDVLATIDRRKHKNEPCEPVKVLCIDEVLEIVKHCPLAGDVIERIGTEGRKMRVYGLFSAQSWKASRVGGSTARDNLTSKFAHRMERKQADMLLQDSDQTRIVKKLRKGQALFCPHNGSAEVLSIPYCAPDDMRLVADLVTSVTGSLPDVTADRYQSVTAVVTSDDRGVTTLQQMLQHPPVSLSKIAQETGINKGYLYQIAQGKPMSADARQKLETYRKTLTN